MLYRRRTLETPHGSTQTPILFPVRNIGKRSTDNTPRYSREIPDLSTALVNANAIRSRDAQWQRIENGAQLRDEMQVPESTIVYADSGGFGFSDQPISTTPEQIYETQCKINADIYGTLDQPLSPDNRQRENQDRIEANIQHALTASELHSGDALLLASVHGYDPETIRNNIHYLEKHGEFDGFALGSLVPIERRYEKVTKLIIAARQATDKHLHVYGLGGHVYQPLLLYLGVDSYDSTSFIRSAGNRRYFVPGFGGGLFHEFENLDYLPCACPVCSSNELPTIRADRDLIARHNLWAMMVELRRFQYIVEIGQDIEEYLEIRFMGNTETKQAFQTAKQQIRGLK